MSEDMKLQKKILKILPYLNEKQKRIFVASEALYLGYGGVSKMARLTKLSRPTIHRGIEDLGSRVKKGAVDRIRLPGGGRKASHVGNKELKKEIKKLVEGTTRGDPMTPLKWTCKSSREISKSISNASHTTVATILKDLGYSLQANEKSLESKSHPDRNAQFEYINSEVKRFMSNGWPVISVDAKKRELMGNYKNNGREWRKKGKSRKVKTYDFREKDTEVAIPYGVYDMQKNLGWVNVGCDHNTACFAVQSIQRWWNHMGRKDYQKAAEILICADGGGSNSHRTRLWKFKLQEFASKSGLKVTVCHFPPGASKWNKIEHRLFSHISMNWRGQPLISHDVVVNLISATKTHTGLKVKAKLDKRSYPTGIKISDEEMEQVCLEKHPFHGDWNYTIVPN